MLGVEGRGLFQQGSPVSLLGAGKAGGAERKETMKNSLTRNSAAATEDHGEWTWRSGAKSGCGWVDEHGPHSLICLNIWSQLVGLLKKGEEVWPSWRRHITRCVPFAVPTASHHSQDALQASCHHTFNSPSWTLSL